MIGPATTVIQTDGSTSLTEVANRYFILYGSSGSGPALKYNGANVTAGEFGGWTPIGAVQTASGYDVAWKNTSTGQYTVWSTDSNGNYTGNLTGAVSGNSHALKSLEPVFQQDLNRDGVIGLTTMVIQTDGSTSLTEVVINFIFTAPADLVRRRNITAPTLRPVSLAPGPPLARCRRRMAMRSPGRIQAATYLRSGLPTATATTPKRDRLGVGKDIRLEVGGTRFQSGPQRRRDDRPVRCAETTPKISQSLSGTSGSATIGGNAALELAAADTRQ